MNQENNFDEIDKMIFDYFKNEKEEPVPKCVKDSINKAVIKIKRSHNNINYIKKIAIIIISFGFLTTSVVFAKDIVHFISALFTNSTESINTAIENNYVQELNTEYVYDKDIGVSLNYILLDDTNLDLALTYQYCGTEEIDEIIIDEFILTTNTGKILWENTKDIKNHIMEGTDIYTEKNSIKVSERFYRDSILILSNQFSNFNKIILEIKSLKVKNNGKYEVQHGNWQLEANIDKEKLKMESIMYNIIPNKYIKDYEIKMTEVSFKIQLDFNILINTEVLKEIDSISLIDSCGTEYNYKELTLSRFDEKSNIQTIYLEYDISKFSENIDKFELKLKTDIDQDIIIKMKQ